jgi:hypothetical protein
MKSPPQLDLFSPRRKPRSFDEAKLIARLREAARPRSAAGLSRAEVKRLMTPLPKITVPR